MEATKALKAPSDARFVQWLVPGLGVPLLQGWAVYDCAFLSTKFTKGESVLSGLPLCERSGAGTSATTKGDESTFRSWPFVYFVDKNDLSHMRRVAP